MRKLATASAKNGRMMTVWAMFKMSNCPQPSQSGGPLPATAVESLIQSVPPLPTVRPVQAQGAYCGLSPPSSTQGPILWCSPRIAAQPKPGQVTHRTSTSETMSQAKLLAFMRTRSGYCSPRRALTPCFLIKIEAVTEYSRKLLHLGNCRLCTSVS